MPWYETAENFCRVTKCDPQYLGCTCCGRLLVGHAIRMLELDQRIDAYHDLGGVPDDKSQGCFPFGLTCAKKQVKKAQDLLKRGNWL